MAVFFFPSHGICSDLRIKATSAISFNWAGGGVRWWESVIVNISLSMPWLEAAMPACHPTAPHVTLNSPQLGINRSCWWGGRTKSEGRHKRLLPRQFSAHTAFLPEGLTALATSIYISSLTAYIHCLHKHCIGSAPWPAGDGAYITAEHWGLRCDITTLYL